MFEKLLANYWVNHKSGFLFIGSGVLVLALLSPLLSWLTVTTPPQSALARVTRVLGSPTKVSSQTGVSQTIGVGTLIYHRDLVSTPEKSLVEAEALPSHLTGTHFRIIAQSQIKLDQAKYQGDHITFQVLSGAVRILKTSSPKKIRILRSGETTRIKSSSQKTTEKAPKNYKDHIRRKMKELSPSFDKCYSILLKQNLRLSGKVQVYFEIQSSGQTESVRIYKTSINEDSFLSCLTQTIERSRFHRFIGKEKKVIFPLVFSQRL